MDNVKTILKSLREFKKPTILTLVFIIAEVFLEVLIPFITARTIDDINAGASLGDIGLTCALMIVAAMASLACGALAGKTGAQASAGLAKNVRKDMYEKIQTFSFSNIDKFSTASLVTRMTTDITNMQNAYMMCIRVAVRSPMMFIFAVVMAFIMGGTLAVAFVVSIPVMIFGLAMIGKYAMPAFKAVFKKYDKLNESVEENVRGMRVVKGFAREDYESEKFSTASDDIRVDFTKAERIVSFNGPLMQFCMFFNMVFVLAVGSKLIITNKGQTINVGELSSMMIYGFQILMSLMCTCKKASRFI